MQYKTDRKRKSATKQDRHKTVQESYSITYVNKRMNQIIYTPNILATFLVIAVLDIIARQSPLNLLISINIK